MILGLFAQLAGLLSILAVIALVLGAEDAPAILGVSLPVFLIFSGTVTFYRKNIYWFFDFISIPW